MKESIFARLCNLKEKQQQQKSSKSSGVLLGCIVEKNRDDIPTEPKLINPRASVIPESFYIENQNEKISDIKLTPQIRKFLEKRIEEKNKKQIVEEDLYENNDYSVENILKLCRSSLASQKICALRLLSTKTLPSLSLCQINDYKIPLLIRMGLDDPKPKVQIESLLALKTLLSLSSNMDISSGGRKTRHGLILEFEKHEIEEEEKNMVLEPFVGVTERVVDDFIASDTLLRLLYLTNIDYSNEILLELIVFFLYQYPNSFSIIPSERLEFFLNSFLLSVVSNWERIHFIFISSVLRSIELSDQTLSALELWNQKVICMGNMKQKILAYNLNFFIPPKGGETFWMENFWKFNYLERHLLNQEYELSFWMLKSLTRDIWYIIDKKEDDAVVRAFRQTAKCTSEFIISCITFHARNHYWKVVSACLDFLLLFDRCRNEIDWVSISIDSLIDLVVTKSPENTSDPFILGNSLIHVIHHVVNVRGIIIENSYKLRLLLDFKAEKEPERTYFVYSFITVLSDHWDKSLTLPLELLDSFKPFDDVLFRDVLYNFLFNPEYYSFTSFFTSIDQLNVARENLIQIFDQMLSPYMKTSSCHVFSYELIQFCKTGNEIPISYGLNVSNSKMPLVWREIIPTFITTMRNSNGDLKICKEILLSFLLHKNVSDYDTGFESWIPLCSLSSLFVEFDLHNIPTAKHLFTNSSILNKSKSLRVFKNLLETLYSNFYIPETMQLIVPFLMDFVPIDYHMEFYKNDIIKITDKETHLPFKYDNFFEAIWENFSSLCNANIFYLQWFKWLREGGTVIYYICFCKILNLMIFGAKHIVAHHVAHLLLELDIQSEEMKCFKSCVKHHEGKFWILNNIAENSKEYIALEGKINQLLM